MHFIRGCSIIIYLHSSLEHGHIFFGDVNMRNIEMSAMIHTMIKEYV